MRTKKKLIAVLLIATILSSLIPNVLSFAEAKPDFQAYVAGTTDTYIMGNIGEEISVDLKLVDGLEGKKGFAFILTYDPTKLEAIPDGYEDGTNEPYWDLAFSNDLAVAGTKMATLVDMDGEFSGLKGITVAFMGNRNLNTSGNIGTFKFKIIGKGTSDIAYTGVKYAGLSDGEDDIAVECTNKVTVAARIPMTELTVEPSAITVNKGKSTTLVATKNPTDTTDTNPVIWTSSNNDVVTVNNNGLVTAIGVGAATITATCGNYSDTSIVTVDNPLKGINLNKISEVINRGTTTTLVATKNPVDTTDTESVVWTSSNNGVVTVDNGLVTAVGIGTATITATCGIYSAECSITVNAPLAGISMNKVAAEIDKDETVQLSVTKNPVDTTDAESVVWTSSNSDVASVDSNGLVTGKSLGTAMITATITTSDGTYTATCNVKVNVHIESVTIVNAGIDASRNLELYKNQTTDLTVEFNPDEFVESKTIIWESSDENIVKVENGKVTAVVPGIATITATTINGKTDSITVTVPVVAATTLTINKINTSIEKGNTEQLITAILPENTTDDTTVTWESSDETVATVVDGLVTAIGVGNATIKAKAAGLEDTCDIEVTCALQEISLDKEELTLEAGTTSEALVVTKNPTDATVNLADVNWTSKNTAVATVVDGKVTAVAPGTAIIDAELNGKTATCEVTVIVTLTGVEIENGDKDLELIKGQTSDLKVVYIPANSTEIPDATWLSSDETIATVDQNGKVTAIKEGNTVITVDYGNGITATRDVVVKEIHADSVVFNKLVESLNKNETVDLDVTILPENTTDDKTITWESSDETILTVDNDGIVKGLKAGKATIKATTVNGKFVEMEIEVKEIALESITVTIDKNVEEGKQTQVKVEKNPEDTTDELVYTYKSSNESIVTVDKNGKVTAKKAGKVVITVSVEATNGAGEKNTVTSQVSLTVTEKPADPAPSGSGSAPVVSTPVAALTTSPHTGDMNIVALTVMMVISLAGMIVTIKKNNN